MQQIPVTPLHAPRFEDGRLLTLAGLAERFGAENCGASIPGLWQKFGAYIGNVPGQIGGVAYGVCHNFDEAGNMDYLCGVEVTDFSSLPREFARLRITPQHYVVFTHSEHVSAIRGTWNAIWGEWLPQSGHEVTDAPFFERYDTGFNPQTGYGGMELWIPLKH